MYVTYFGSSANSLSNANSDFDIEVAVNSEIEENVCDLLSRMIGYLKKYSNGYIEKVFGT